MIDDAHSVHSSAREKVLEHIFIGALLRTLWCAGAHNIEVLGRRKDQQRNRRVKVVLG